MLPPKPLSGAAYLDLLRAHRPRLEWVGDAAEHNFTYDDRGGAKHEVWHPTLKALAERLDLCLEVRREGRRTEGRRYSSPQRRERRQRRWR